MHYLDIIGQKIYCSLCSPHLLMNLLDDEDTTESLTFVVNTIPTHQNRTRYQHAKSLCEEFDTTIICVGSVPEDIIDIAEEVHSFPNSVLSLFPLCLPFWLFFYIFKTRSKTTVVSPHALYILVTYVYSSVFRANMVVDLWDDILLPVESYKQRSTILSRLPQLYHSILYRGARHCIESSDLLVVSLHPGILAKYNLESVPVLELTNGVRQEYLSDCLDEGEVDELHVLYLGRANQKRAVDELLGALSEISIEGIHFDIVGPTDRTIEEIAENHGKVTLHGEVPHSDALAMIERSHVCLCTLPSNVKNYHYSYPIKMFEYAAFGKAIVASKHLGIEEVLTHGKDAILVEPDNYSEVRQQVESLAQNPEIREKLGNEAQKTAECHQWTKITDRYINEIKNVVQDY